MLLRAAHAWGYAQEMLALQIPSFVISCKALGGPAQQGAARSPILFALLICFMRVVASRLWT